jgi:hypothetical protein
MFVTADFLFPDADEKSVPEVLAYIHSHDVETLNTLLLPRRGGSRCDVPL